MTEEQIKFLDEVVLPKLVQMAINDELPLDMTQLSAYHFDEEAEEFNKQNKNLKKSIIEKDNNQKKAILLKHYSFDEICEILGWYDESNETVCTAEMELLEKTNPSAFEEKMMDEAIINGNFEEVIEKDCRFPI